MDDKYIFVTSMIWDKTRGINQKINTIRDDFLKYENIPHSIITKDDLIIILSKYSEVILDYNTLLAQIICDLTGKRIENICARTDNNSNSHKQ